MTAVRKAPARRVPPLGGFNPTLLRLEVRRMLRNGRTLVFTFVVPVVFFLIFGTNAAYADENVGHGNVVAYIMISMALYGAMLATTSGGAMVSVERAAGWSRQLRLTPLTPAAYVSVKLVVAMLFGLGSVAVVNAAGLFTQASTSVGRWLTAAALCWLLSVVFAAFGLFMGYLLPTENVMQILGPALALLAFGGGLFVPLQDGSLWQRIAEFTPMYGINQIAHVPLTGDPVQAGWVVSVLGWLAVFAAGAGWRFRRDTARV